MEIHIKNLQKKLHAERGKLTFLQHFAEQRIDWMHACGGKGRCTTCKFEIIEGRQNISEHSPFEEKLRQKNVISSSERLACQCLPLDDVTISVPKINQLPHLNYLD
ncbi:MAG: 2Fe-2S iron-sulfur cluster-binding protein [Bacteroidota bacterium]